MCLSSIARPVSHTNESPWERHTIDNTSSGADGVKLADVNGDGRMDIATGWESGGVSRIYLQPDRAAVRALWPSITVGEAPNVEDAVFVDLDSDGAVDVVSSCEGDASKMFIHWAPAEPADYADASKWSTEPIPATDQGVRWMYAMPMQVDGRRGSDLVVGSKEGGSNADGAMVGWLEAPEDPRDLAAWRLHRFHRARWIMSLQQHDIDSDGDRDIVVSERRPGASARPEDGGVRFQGVYWLENPGAVATVAGEPWVEHAILNTGAIGKRGASAMFIDGHDFNGDQRVDFAIAVARELPDVSDEIHLVTCPDDPEKTLLHDETTVTTWHHEVVTPSLPHGVGTAKAVAVGNVNVDGAWDLIYSCEKASGALHGTLWMEKTGRSWTTHLLGGPEGTKYDRLELLDIDEDGDLDVLTCEEAVDLGVFWYENPFGAGD